MKKILSLITLAFFTLTCAQQTPHYLLTSTPQLELGQTLTGELDLADGQNFKDGARLELVKMYLEANEVVQLELNSNSFDTYLTVFDSANNYISSNDDSADSSNSNLIFVTEEAGRYMIVVSGYSDFDLGEYSLSAMALDVVDDGEINLADTLSGILDSTDDDLGGRFLDAFTLELAEKTTLSIAMTSDTLDSYLIVLDENGSTLAENDDDEISLNSYLELELDEGTYTIWATTNATDEFGFYELMLEALD